MADIPNSLTASEDASLVAPRPAAVVRVERSLRAETTVTGFAWSPDGQKFATYADFGRLITIWGTDGSPITQMRGERSYFYNSMAFRPDGGELITPAVRADDEHSALTLWSTQTGSAVGSVPGPHPDRPARYNRAVAFALSSDGQRLAAITSAIPDEPVTVYSVGSPWRQERLGLNGGGQDHDGAQSVAISPDASLLAIGTLRGEVRLFDLARRQGPLMPLIVYPPPPLIGVGAMAFSPDGRYLATGATAATGDSGGDTDALSDRRRAPIKVWRLMDGALVATYAGDYAPIRQLSWSIDGRFLAAAAGDRSMRMVWPALPGWPGVRIEFPDPVMAVGFSPDGSALAAAAGADVTVFAVSE